MNLLQAITTSTRIFNGSFFNNDSLLLAKDCKIGFHVSISGGISNSVDNALKIGCNTFQIFTRSPRGWSAKPLKEQDVQNFRKKLIDSDIDRESVFVHMPYLPNLSSPDSYLHKKSTNTLVEELRRSNVLGIAYVILHLGRHGGKGKDNGLSQLVKACNFAFEKYYKLSSVVENKKKGSKSRKGKQCVTILLENGAGEKHNIASQFNELGSILDRLKSSSSSFGHSYGICLDTCHAFAAGYDLRTQYSVNETLDRFNSDVGLRNLKLIHMNDSKDKLNSNRDRHEHIGLGEIGREGFRALLNHKILKKLPFIMETPIDSRRNDPDNMKVVLGLLNKNK